MDRAAAVLRSPAFIAFMLSLVLLLVALTWFASPKRVTRNLNCPPGFHTEELNVLEEGPSPVRILACVG